MLNSIVLIQPDALRDEAGRLLLSRTAVSELGARPWSARSHGSIKRGSPFVRLILQSGTRGKRLQRHPMRVAALGTWPLPDGARDKPLFDRRDL